MSDRITRTPRGGKDPSAARHLRLISPTSPKGPRKPKPPLFSAEEAGRLRAALRHCRILYGTWACAGSALYADPCHLIAIANGRARFPGTVAIRLAKALGVSFDALIKPGLRVVPFVEICPACGAKVDP